MKQETIEKMQKVLQQAVDEKIIAGGNLMTLQDGRELCYQEAGMADVAGGVPVRRDTIFRMYSMSKPITSAAAMILMERGVIDLMDPVSRYLPGFVGQKVWTPEGPKPVRREMLIKDLLSMTSGLPYGDESNEAGRQSQLIFDEAIARLRTEHPMTTVELANRLGRNDLHFQPGEHFMYGTSADVMGAVVEIASGMSFGEFLRKEIFEPLGMEDTGFYVPEEKQSRLSKVYTNGKVPQEYTFDHLAIMNEMKRPPAFESGGAGLVSTIDDYAAFAKMLLGGGLYNGHRILSERTVQYMTTCHLNEQQLMTLRRDWNGLDGYSYGNFMRVMMDPGRAYYMAFEGEYGWSGWLGSYFFNAPKEKLTFLLMFQLTDSGITRLTRCLRNVLAAGL